MDPTPGDAADDVRDVVVQAGGPTGQGVIDICDYGHLRSADGGNTWTLGSGLPAGRCSLAVSPDEPYVLLAAASDNNIYETDNAGASWTNLGTPDSRRQGRIPFAVTNQRSGNAFDLWFGDVSLFRGGCTTPAMPSPGGANRCPAGRATPASPPPAGWAGPFTRNGQPLPPPTQSMAHDDVGDLLFDIGVATDACPVIFSSDGGVYTNTDLGAGCQDPDWDQPDLTPHALWIYGMDGADQPGDTNEDLYFGTQDNGTFATTDLGLLGPTWFNRDCCDGFDFVADATRVISTLCCGFSIRRSNQDLLGTTALANNPPGGLPQFNFPDFIDQFGNNQYIAVTTSGGFITNDVTASPIGWTQLGAGSTPGGGFCAVQAPVDVGGTPTFYAQTQCIGGLETSGPSQLWKYVGTDPGNTWQRVDNNGLAGGFGITAVAPTDPNRLYASNLAVTGPNMVSSTDGGLTWQTDPNLDTFMTASGTFNYTAQRGPTSFTRFGGYTQPSLLAFHPQNPNVVVAGGRDSGIFMTANGGQSWTLLSDPNDSGNSGIPHLPRPWFAYFDTEPTDPPGKTTFYVGTQGRGVWRVSVVAADLGIEKDDSPDPVAASGELTYTLTVTNNGPGEAEQVTVIDQLPPEVTYLSDNAGCSHGAGTVTCNIGTLAALASKNIEIKVFVDPGLVDDTGMATLTNTATVSSSATPDPNPANDTVSEQTKVLPGCAGQLATLVGTAGSDSIIGTTAADIIATLAGVDSIIDPGGNDKICSGKGNDSVAGGLGDDFIDGGPDNDNISGGAGNDTIHGGPGNDSISGGAGNDTIDGGPDNDSISGGAGLDTCTNGEVVAGC